MGKTEKVHFSCAVVLPDISWTPMKFYRSRLFSDLGQSSLVHHLSTFSKDFSYYRVIFHLISNAAFRQWGDGEKIYVFGWGHMTKMAAVSIYGRNQSSFSELLGWLPWNLVCSFWESSTTKLYYIKLWPVVDLDIFYCQVIFEPLVFWIEKTEKKVHFLLHLCSVIWKCSQPQSLWFQGLKAI